LDKLTLLTRLTAGQLIKIVPSFPKVLGKWNMPCGLPWFAYMVASSVLSCSCLKLRQFAESRVLVACLRVSLFRVETRDSPGYPDRIDVEPKVGRTCCHFRKVQQLQTDDCCRRHRRRSPEWLGGFVRDSIGDCIEESAPFGSRWGKATLGTFVAVLHTAKSIA
jgi:hypothetical protein